MDVFFWFIAGCLSTCLFIFFGLWACVRFPAVDKFIKWMMRGKKQDGG